MKIQQTRIFCGNKGTITLMSHNGHFKYGFWQDSDGDVTVEITAQEFTRMAIAVALEGPFAGDYPWQRFADEFHMNHAI